MNAEKGWKTVLKTYLSIIATNGIIIVACLILAHRFLLPFMQSIFVQEWLARTVTAAITLLAISPFLWALAIRKLKKGSLVALEVVRVFLAVFLLGALLQWLFSFWIAAAGTLLVIPLLLLAFRKKLEKSYSRIRARFLYNLNEKEKLRESTTALSPWDAHIVNYEVSPNAGYIGVPLEELGWREKYGINITSIERGDIKIYAPGRNIRLFPFDKIGVLGTDEQLQAFKPIVDTPVVPIPDQPEKRVVLQKLVIDDRTPLKGQTIRSSGIREKTNGLVVGIERARKRILNPPSDMQFEPNDIVWIVGEAGKINLL
jgi:CPA2 family monovalent cation:H+ antiporter-2